jgi:hypothetical protein
MGRPTNRIAAIAEFGLWVVVVALIASALGMRLPFDLPTFASASHAPGIGALASAGPSASVTPAPTPTAAPTPAPTPAPTASPIVKKLQAYLARKDFQFQATQTGSNSFTGTNGSVEEKISGTVAYKVNDEADTTKTTFQGKTTTQDSVYTGTSTYERTDAGPWIKRARTPADTAQTKVLLSPTRLFVDAGVETKNGSSLHRLEVADPAALSAAVVATGTVTSAQLTATFWTKDDGTPVYLRLDGTADQQVNGATVHATIAQELALIKWSGVTIATPKNAWQQVVDGVAGMTFGLPADWTVSDLNKPLGITTYAGQSGQLAYASESGTGLTLDQAVARVAATFVDAPGARTQSTVGGEAAIQFGVHRTKQKDYVSTFVLLHAGQLYQFGFWGQSSDAATDKLAAQIMGTLAFTR